MTHESQDGNIEPVLTGFAHVLRDRTAMVHRQAERSGFIADLIRGRATREGYALFLRNLVPAYAALEPALARHHESPLLAAFADPRLARLPNLTHDIEALVGPDWPSTLSILPEAAAYAQAITKGASGDGSELVAHAYARYLGDLSGGQILKPLLARTLGLDADTSRFYDFPEIADLGAPKVAMRVALDRVPGDSPMAASIVTAAIAAFHHNIAVSEAVQRASS